MRRLFVVPSERMERPHPCGRVAAIRGCVVTQLKQSAFNLNHSAYGLNGLRRSFQRRIELIAKQMLDVIDEQFLMLHLVFETEPNDPQDLFPIIAMGKLFDESRHLLIDVGAILSGLSNRGARTSAALRPFNPRTE